MFKLVFALILTIFFINNVQARSLIACPDQANPGTLVSDQQVSSTFLQGIDVRVPAIGLLENPISCVLVVDDENSQNSPVITGGVGSRYVRVQIKPFLLETLSYRVQVYTETPSTTAAPTTAA